MPTDMPPGADTPPIDELSSAEASLVELRQIVHRIADDDLGKQTACNEFDVAGLTDHLTNSIILAARPTLDAWRTRGIDGTVKVDSNDVPAKVVAGILSLEFLIHAWDYAQAIGQRVDPTPEFAEFVFGVARSVITPQGRTNGGFDDPIDIAEDAPVFDRLLAFTGRRPN